MSEQHPECLEAARNLRLCAGAEWYRQRIAELEAMGRTLAAHNRRAEEENARLRQRLPADTLQAVCDTQKLQIAELKAVLHEVAELRAYNVNWIRKDELRATLAKYEGEKR